MKQLRVFAVAAIWMGYGTVGQANDAAWRYMDVIQGSEIFAPIADKKISVGWINKGEKLQVRSLPNGQYEFKFGHGYGLINKKALQPLTAAYSIVDRLGERHKPLTNDKLITIKPTQVCSKANMEKCAPLATLASNLRYPIVYKLQDKQSQRWYQILLGGRVGYIQASDTELDTGLPVLTYHHILKNRENETFRNVSTTNSLRAFSKQMAFLKESGYQTITLPQLEQYLHNRINLPGKVVAITFDDGLKSVAKYAYPILKSLGFNATSFVITSRIKRYPEQWDPLSLQFMSIKELQEIQDIFALHSHTHFLHRLSDTNHPILLSRSKHNILFDFEHSRRVLKDFTPAVRYLAYPFGGYDKNAIEAAKLAGFKLAFTTLEGKVKPGDNPYTLKRLYIADHDSTEKMASLLGNSE